MRNFDQHSLPVHPLPLLASVATAIFVGPWFGPGFTAVACAICAFAYIVWCGLITDRSGHQNDLVLRLSFYIDLVIGLAVFLWGLTSLDKYLEFFHATMTLPVALLLAPCATLILLILQIILLGAMSPAPARVVVRH